MAADATYSHTHIMAGATLASFPDHEGGKNRPVTRLQPGNLPVLVSERCTVQLILKSVGWGSPSGVATPGPIQAQALVIC